MRQSGVISKYSATETAEVLFLRFSTFTKDELVLTPPPRKDGQSPRSTRPASTTSTASSPPPEVPPAPPSPQRPATRSLHPRPGLLNLRRITRMPGPLRAHQPVSAGLPLRLHGVRLEDSEMHLPQLLKDEDSPERLPTLKIQ